MKVGDKVVMNKKAIEKTFIESGKKLSDCEWYNNKIYTIIEIYDDTIKLDRVFHSDFRPDIYTHYLILVKDQRKEKLQKISKNV